MITEIDSFDVRPAVGRWVKPDGWRYGSPIIDGDDFSTFRIPTHCGGPIKDLAVEIQVTGRTIQRKWEMRLVRVKITFPGDGEPDQITYGYMEIPW